MQLLKIQINRQDDHSGPSLLPVLLLLIFGITGFTIFQDFLHSSYHNYAFHFSESLLFKSFWLLFLPFSFLQLRLLKLLKRSVSFIPALLVPIVLHVAAFALSVWLLSALLFTHTYAFKDLIGYTLSEDSYKYLLIYGAITLLYIRQQAAAQKPTAFPTAPVKKITIGSARNFISIAVDEILYISSAAPYIAIRTQQKSHLHAESLKSILKKLDPQQFIRIHKSTILNLEQVSAYKSRLNGDYDVLLKNGESLRLSRNYGATFKELMG